MKEKKESQLDVEALKLKLEKAVKEENYELAAELRDKIRALEKSPSV